MSAGNGINGDGAAGQARLQERSAALRPHGLGFSWRGTGSSQAFPRCPETSRGAGLCSGGGR